MFVIYEVDQSSTITDLIHYDPSMYSFSEKPPFNYKWLKVIKDNNHKFLVIIEQDKSNRISSIITKVKEKVKERINATLNVIESMNFKKLEIIYCFAIAPKNKRWDIAGMATYDINDTVLLIAEDFHTKENYYLSIKKEYKGLNKRARTDIQKDIFKYIDEQKKLAKND